MLPAYRQVILDKLKRTAGMADIEDRIVVERHLTPQDIPRPLQGAERRDLRAGKPRPLHGRLQARQPLAPGEGASISPAGRASRVPACRW
jgi:hypothetical protein